MLMLICKHDKKVYLMLYEPHGADGTEITDRVISDQYKLMKSKFINFIKAVIIKYGKIGEKNIIVVNSYEISLKKGIQNYMKDNHGFC